MNVANLGLIFSQCMSIPPQLFKILIYHANDVFPRRHVVAERFPWPDAAIVELPLEANTPDALDGASSVDALLTMTSEEELLASAAARPAAPSVGPSPAARAALPPAVGPSPVARALAPDLPPPPAVGPSPAARSADAGAQLPPPVRPSPAARALADVGSALPMRSTEVPAPPPVGPSPAARAVTEDPTTGPLPIAAARAAFPGTPLAAAAAPPPIGPSPAARSADGAGSSFRP